MCMYRCCCIHLILQINETTKQNAHVANEIAMLREDFKKYKNILSVVVCGKCEWELIRNIAISKLTL